MRLSIFSVAEPSAVPGVSALVGGVLVRLHVAGLRDDQVLCHQVGGFMHDSMTMAASTLLTVAAGLILVRMDVASFAFARVISSSAVNSHLRTGLSPGRSHNYKLLFGRGSDHNDLLWRSWSYHDDWLRDDGSCGNKNHMISVRRRRNCSHWSPSYLVIPDDQRSLLNCLPDRELLVDFQLKFARLNLVSVILRERTRTA